MLCLFVFPKHYKSVQRFHWPSQRGYDFDQHNFICRDYRLYAGEFFQCI